MPSVVIKILSPYEKLHEIPPSYDHLKSFGCLCFAASPKVGRDKFQSRAIPSIFWGNLVAKKGDKLLNIFNHFIFFSMDIVFHEHVFPYKSDSSPVLSLFPLSALMDYIPPPASSTSGTDHSSSSIPPSNLVSSPSTSHSPSPLHYSHVSPSSSSSNYSSPPSVFPLRRSSRPV